MSESGPGSLVRAALDRAIAEVAEEEVDRLCEGNRSRLQHVHSALESLMKLEGGNEPDYSSEWVSLFYLTWYQPRQINLAYSTLRPLVKEYSPPRYLIDYGCGAWAAQFALAVIFAEIPELQGSGVGVHGIDPNEPMSRIGEKLWRKFLTKVRDRDSNDSFFRSLQGTMESMNDSCRCYASYGDALQLCEPLRRRLDNCWFMAMHAIYETNQTDLRDVLGRILEEQAPTLSVATFHELRSRDWMPLFTELGFNEERLKPVWSGNLAHTGRWRRKLSRDPDLQDAILTAAGQEDPRTRRTKGLLATRSVSWDLTKGHVVMTRSGGQ